MKSNRARRITWMVAALSAMTSSVALPVTADAASGTAPASGAAVERWDVRGGWVDLPAPPTSAPSHGWSATFDAPYVLQSAGVVVVSEPSSNGIRLARIDPRTGEDLWSVDLPIGDVGPSSPVEMSADGSLVFVDSAHRDGVPTANVVITTADGQQIWETGSQELVLQGRVIGDLAVLVTTGAAVAVDVATGTERWRYDDLFDLVGGSLVLYSSTPTIGIADPATGELLWHATTDDDEFWWPHVIGGTMLQIGDDGAIRGLDAATGDVVFENTVSGLGGSAVVPGGGDVAVVLGDGDGDGPAPATAQALDLATGEALWSADLSDERDVDSYRIDGEVYVTIVGNHRVEVRRGATGEVVASFDSTGDRLSSAGGVVYEHVGDELVARSLPSLDEMRRITWPEDTGVIAVDGGILTESDPTELDDGSASISVSGYVTD